MTNDQRNHGPGPRLYQPGARIPQDDQARKDAPMYRGLLGYFPAALFAVAAHSLASDRKHNGPGSKDPHWARGKSTDHADCIVRHLIDAGASLADADAWAQVPLADRPDAEREHFYHLTALAWRALALLQEECERAGAAPGTSSVFPAPKSAAPIGVVVGRALAGPARGDFIVLGGGGE